MKKILKVFFWIVKLVVLYSASSFIAIFISLVMLMFFGRYDFDSGIDLNKITYLSLTAGIVIAVSSIVFGVINYLIKNSFKR